MAKRKRGRKAGFYFRMKCSGWWCGNKNAVAHFIARNEYLGNYGYSRICKSCYARLQEEPVILEWRVVSYEEYNHGNIVNSIMNS